jgi:hypothetical protein
MLAGVSQAAYCLTRSYAPTLLTNENIARSFFNKVDIRFRQMLAPKSEATLDIELEQDQSSSLPSFNLDGFISGKVSCDLGRGGSTKNTLTSELSHSASSVLKAFYNNGSDLTLKELEKISGGGWRARSHFKQDKRLKLCGYTTTTQVIVGLSQLAFAVVGDTLESSDADLSWSRNNFVSSMSDQALVKLSYSRGSECSQDLNLLTELASSRNVRGCKFVRLNLAGDITGTMDNMLSPRIPVKSVRVSGNVF